MREHALPRLAAHFDRAGRIAHQGFDCIRHGCYVASWNEKAGLVLNHDLVRRARARRDERDARRHRFKKCQAKAFIAGGEGVNQNALIPGRHVVDRQFAKKAEDHLEVVFASDPAANPFLRMMLLGCLLTLGPMPKRA